MPPSIFKTSFFRSLPVSLALVPIGILMGILAGNRGWQWLDVLLFSVVGFSGSAQFAYLGLVQQTDLTISTLFLIILSINLRYLPMSLSASRPMRIPFLPKFITSHYLADESFALETQDYSNSERIVNRFTLVGCWVTASLIGVLLIEVIPQSVLESVANFTFPVNLILILISWNHIAEYFNLQVIANSLKQGTLKLKDRNLLGLMGCFVLSILFFYFLGKKFFWITGIVACLIYLIWLERRAGKVD